MWQFLAGALVLLTVWYGLRRIARGFSVSSKQAIETSIRLDMLCLEPNGNLVIWHRHKVSGGRFYDYAFVESGGKITCYQRLDVYPWERYSPDVFYSVLDAKQDVHRVPGYQKLSIDVTVEYLSRVVPGYLRHVVCPC